MDARLRGMHNTAAGPRRVVLLLAAAIMVSACSGRLAGSAVAQGDGSILRSQSPPSVLSSAGATVDQSQGSATSDPAVPSDPTVPDSPSASAGQGTLLTDASEAQTAQTAQSPTSEPSSAEPSDPGSSRPMTPTAPSPTATPTTAGPRLDISHFVTPSGNITCQYLTGQVTSVRCDLAESDITEQHDCHGIGDWGHAVVLESGKPAGMQCISDSVMAPGLPVLAYGSSTVVGDITCSSSKAGVHCQDTSGHAFDLSRAAYRVR